MRAIGGLLMSRPTPGAPPEEPTSCSRVLGDDLSACQLGFQSERQSRPSPPFSIYRTNNRSTPSISFFFFFSLCVRQRGKTFPETEWLANRALFFLFRKMQGDSSNRRHYYIYLIHTIGHLLHPLKAKKKSIIHNWGNSERRVHHFFNGGCRTSAFSRICGKWFFLRQYL